MAPNAMQVFHRLGLAEKINAAGVPLRNIQVVDGQMRPIMRTDQDRIRQKFGYTTTAIKRARLQALLLVETDPASILLSKTYVSSQDEPDGPRWPPDQCGRHRSQLHHARRSGSANQTAVRPSITLNY